MPRKNRQGKSEKTKQIEKRNREKEVIWRYLLRSGMSYDNAVSIVKRFIENLHIKAKEKGAQRFRVWDAIKIATLPDGTKVELRDIPPCDREYVMSAAVNQVGLVGDFCKSRSYWILNV